MKKPALVVMGYLVLSAVVIGFGVYMLGSHYLNKPAAEATASCEHIGWIRMVAIHDDVLSAQHISAHVCDELTITNIDDRLRLMAFGQHDNHQPYDGVTEKLLQQNQSLTVTLNQPGNYTFHDHLDDSVQGTFTVRN